MVSSTTRSSRSAVGGRKRPRKPRHRRGASSMVKKVSTAIVTRVTSVETRGRAHRERGGRLEHLGDLRGELGRALREVLLQVQPVDQPAERAVALLAPSRMRSGIWCPKCTALVTSGSANRYTRPPKTRSPPRKNTVAERRRGDSPRRLRKRVGGVKQQREEEGDHDVEHDRAQDPQPEDQGRVEIEQRDGDRGGHDDGGQRDPPPIRHSPGAGTRQVSGALPAMAASLAALRTSGRESAIGDGRRRTGGRRTGEPDAAGAPGRTRRGPRTRRRRRSEAHAGSRAT